MVGGWGSTHGSDHTSWDCFPPGILCHQMMALAAVRGDAAPEGLRPSTCAIKHSGVHCRALYGCKPWCVEHLLKRPCFSLVCVRADTTQYPPKQTFLTWVRNTWLSICKSCLLQTIHWDSIQYFTKSKREDRK